MIRDNNDRYWYVQTEGVGSDRTRLELDLEFGGLECGIDLSGSKFRTGMDERRREVWKNKT